MANLTRRWRLGLRRTFQWARIDSQQLAKRLLRRLLSLYESGGDSGFEPVTTRPSLLIRQAWNAGLEPRRYDPTLIEKAGHSPTFFTWYSERISAVPAHEKFLPRYVYQEDQHA